MMWRAAGGEIRATALGAQSLSRGEGSPQTRM